MADHPNGILVSVVVPCYNHGIYLTDALESVLIQSYLNWECIIVNDGSADDTEKIAKEWRDEDNRFKYIKKENGGLSSARNAGINAATGTYVLPLDADDMIGKDYIKDAVEAFNTIPNLKLVYCFSQNFGANEDRGDQPYLGFKHQLLYNQIFCSSIFKKADAIEVGLYNENMKYGLEDWDFLLRMLDERSVVYQIPKYHFLCRKHEISMWKGLENSDRLVEMYALLYANNFAAYSKYWPSFIQLLRNFDNNERIVERIKNSNSYKIGNVVTLPIRLLKKIIRRKQLTR